MANVVYKDLGSVTAYASAVEGGYTGKYADFCRDQANFERDEGTVRPRSFGSCSSDGDSSEDRSSDVREECSGIEDRGGFITDCSGSGEDRSRNSENCGSGVSLSCEGFRNGGSGVGSIHRLYRNGRIERDALLENRRVRRKYD